MIRALAIAVCCSCSALAQQPLVLLDPARGGGESGGRIADRLPEKQVTLDMAGRLASLLRARGFAVVMTREADVDVSSEARAALANNALPLACILLHASASGSGVHLYSSAMRQKIFAGNEATLWDEAQAAYVDRSHALAGDLKSSLERSGIAASTARTWMRPLDNMQCAAVAVEIAPQKDGTGAEDRTYQGQIANALANTLLLWRSKVQTLTPAAPLPPAASQAAVATAVPPKTSETAIGPGVTKPPAPLTRTTPQTSPTKPLPPTIPALPAQPDRTEP